MQIQMVLFDLDGTLLPMDMENFTTSYFKLLAKKLAPYGYTDPKQLVDAIWSGTAAMVRNDGSVTNEEAFWKRFVEIYGEERLADKPLFEEFYAVDFQQAQVFCGFAPLAAEAVRLLRENGKRVALATNPIFPTIATESRIRWAGLSPEDFECYTTYETSRHSKPNPAYFRDVAAQLNVPAEACLMVGNDVEEDMVAAGSLGMKVFLLTDCLINKKERDIEAYPHGGFPELLQYLRENVL